MKGTGTATRESPRVFVRTLHRARHGGMVEPWRCGTPLADAALCAGAGTQLAHRQV